MAEPSPEPSSDEEMLRRARTRLEDPEVKARIARIREQIASGEPTEVITAEELPAFLRAREPSSLGVRP